MKRTIAALAIALSLTTTPITAHAADWQRQQPIPGIAVTVYAAADGFQLEWDSQVGEHGEEWCPTTRCVNATLAKIGEEWTYSVEWKQA